MVARFACKKPIYDNCAVLNMKGELISYATRKKAEWYLEKGLARVVKDQPFTIGLTFEPVKQVPIDGVECRRNACVVCGHDEHYSRFHLVPTCYSKHFPAMQKAFRSHDIVVVCLPCHRVINARYSNVHKELQREFGNPTRKQASVGSVRKAARILLNDEVMMKVPETRKDELLRRVADFFGKTTEELEEDDLETAAMLDDAANDHIVSFGKHVTEELLTRESPTEEIEKFILFWRERFVTLMEPQYLPTDWQLYYELRVEQ